MFKLIPTILVVLVSNSLIKQNTAAFIRTTQVKDCGVIEEIPGEDRTKVPWNAAIFFRGSAAQPFTYHITGVIIGPTTILTVVSGIYGQPIGKIGKYFLSPANNYKVVVGLKSTDLNDMDDKSQVAEVSHVLPFSGPSDNREYHFFILQLKNPLNFDTPYVKPLCVLILAKQFPEEGYTFLQNIKYFRHGGFTNPPLPNGSNPLRVLNITLEVRESCTRMYRKFYRGLPESVFCAKNTFKKENPYCPLLGAPFTFKLNGIWYMAGLHALTPPLYISDTLAGTCHPDNVYFYARYIKATDWIDSIVRCGSGQFACEDASCIRLRNLCDGRPHCKKGEDEDPIFCRARKPCIYDGKTFECGVYDKCISPGQVCDGTVDCSTGLDEEESQCKNKNQITTDQKKYEPPGTGNQSPANAVHAPNNCPSLRDSQNVMVRCSDSNGEFITICEQPEIGTVARFQCQNYYSRLPDQTTFEDLTCGSGLTWSKSDFNFICEIHCGFLKSQIEDRVHLQNGRPTSFTVDSFPWHASIYNYVAQGKYEYICGGTLVEPNILLTLAQCLTTRRGNRIENLLIIVGGVSRNIADNVLNTNAQFLNVMNISIHPQFNSKTLESDIAIMKLEKSVKLGEYVHPVCYLSKARGNLDIGEKGQMAGLNFVKASINNSTYLRYAEYPVKSSSDCSKALKFEQLKSTFCAGFQNEPDTGICKGDIGGGMVFLDKTSPIQRYVLKGILSHGELRIGESCNPNNYGILTKVNAFADWISSEIMKLNNIPYSV